jgi:hypothetical protein
MKILLSLFFGFSSPLLAMALFLEITGLSGTMVVPLFMVGTLPLCFYFTNLIFKHLLGE